jgi:hypothetical protein
LQIGRKDSELLAEKSVLPDLVVTTTWDKSLLVSFLEMKFIAFIAVSPMSKIALILGKVYFLLKYA